MNAFKCGRLRLHFQKDLIAVFFPLLQQGFFVEITAGNIQDMLCRVCEMSPEDLHNLIQTLFLNGKPVDDMKKVFVQDGDCLALSAAMPGLVGATMRSGGVLAGFRHAISHRSTQARSDPGGGLLTIKLFNLLIKEIGPRFLRRGILVASSDLRDLLSSLSKADWKYCQSAELNAQRIQADALMDMDWPQGLECMHLNVTFGQPSGMAKPNVDLEGDPG